MQESLALDLDIMVSEGWTSTQKSELSVLGLCARLGRRANTRPRGPGKGS